MRELLLDRKLYSKSAVDLTVEAFAELARITLTQAGDHLRVTFEEIDPDVEAVIDREFANYALQETVERRR
jgi:hypothetical protein